MEETAENFIAEPLTPIHWELYRLIEGRTLDTEEKVSQREIYEHLKAKGYDVSWKDSQNQHNDHCRWLWNLIHEINVSMEVDHIIVHDQDYNYCLGSESETLALWWHYYQRSETAKERHVAILAKISQNGQYKLFSNQGKPIDEKSLVKLYHETFNSKGKKKGRVEA